MKGVPAPFPKVLGNGWLGRASVGLNLALIRVSKTSFPTRSMSKRRARPRSNTCCAIPENGARCAHKRYDKRLPAVSTTGLSTSWRPRRAEGGNGAGPARTGYLCGEMKTDASSPDAAMQVVAGVLIQNGRVLICQRRRTTIIRASGSSPGERWNPGSASMRHYAVSCTRNSVSTSGSVRCCGARASVSRAAALLSHILSCE